jgi:hypothetical protein
MVLHEKLCGRLGDRRHKYQKARSEERAFLAGEAVS